VKLSPTSITVRTVENAREAEELLPLPVLTRLCSAQRPSRVRQRHVYLSNVVVALDRDSPIGFAAYKPGKGPVRVAHEFWVDEHALGMLAPAIEAMLTALEGAVKSAGCSGLFLVVAQSTAIRRVLENSGYTISLAGGELSWFEKSLAEDWRPGESA